MPILFFFLTASLNDLFKIKQPVSGEGYDDISGFLTLGFLPDSRHCTAQHLCTEELFFIPTRLMRKM